MATVGKWTGSGVQATGSAGGRLSKGGVLEEEKEEGGERSLGMAGLYKHPVLLPRLLHHSCNVWPGLDRKISSYPCAVPIKPAPSEPLNLAVRFC